MLRIFFIIIVNIFFINSIYCQDINSSTLLPDPEGIYHSAYPDFGWSEDIVTDNRLVDFVNLVQKDIVWAYFSNNWFNGIIFPKEALSIIKNQGKIPFIRMMPRSTWEQGGPDPIYTHQKIIDGFFDQDLKKWALEAKDYGMPLIVEFGTEVNGDWFPWNGKYSGGGNFSGYGDSNIPDGPERFRDAYRHIIDLFRKEGVKNITWFFHVNSDSQPKIFWNNMALYYPGDDYIDWIGVSIYGIQHPKEQWQSFIEVIDNAYSELCEISNKKPLAILEWGVIDDLNIGSKAQWIKEALDALIQNKYPRVKAISYWHSTWQNDDGVISNMRLDSSVESLKAYQNGIKNPFFVTKAYFYNDQDGK